MKVYSKQKFIKNGLISASRKNYSGHGHEHSHDFFEIEYIVSGNGEYIVNGESFPLRAGMLFFLSPADLHFIKTEKAELINVMFPCSFFEANLLFSLFSSETSVALLIDENEPLIKSLLEEVVSSSRQEQFENARQYLNCVLLKLSSLKGETTKRQKTHIASAIIYILENFRSNISLKETAEHSGLNPSYLSSIFPIETGKNFKEYLDDLRFDYAIKLLSSTNIPICELCYLAGFNDYSNFSRRFRQKYNCSPKDFRKNKNALM